MPRRRNTTQAGYGSTHQKLRAQWAALVDEGVVDCWRCRQPIQPGSLWDLGHHDWDRSITNGPEHQRCNRSAAAHKKNLMRNTGSRPHASRNW